MAQAISILRDTHYLRDAQSTARDPAGWETVTMKVMMLMWGEIDAASGDQADIDVWADFDAEVRAAGVFVENGALAPAGQSMLVRPDIAKPAPDEARKAGTATPGAKQIQAFYLVEVADLDEALDWARRLPTYGTVEVRALLEY